MSDDELIKQIQIGDERAAEELINRYYAPILRYCKWHCPDMARAEDLTQETFLKLFHNLSAYSGKKKFKAYLYTIANRLCIDESRKTPLYPLIEAEEPAGENREMAELENKAEIHYLLQFLSPEQKEAVLLRFGEELAFHEIAVVTGCNLRTAQSRVRHALKIMRRELENEK